MRCFAEEVKCVSLSFDSSEVHYTAVKKCLDKQCAPSEVARVVKGKKEMGETGEGGGQNRGEIWSCTIVIQFLHSILI